MVGMLVAEGVGPYKLRPVVGPPIGFRIDCGPTNGLLAAPVPRRRSIPSVTMMTSRLIFCCGHRLSKLMSDKYGLSWVDNLPRGKRMALAAREWSAVKSCAI